MGKVNWCSYGRWKVEGDGNLEVLMLQRARLVGFGYGTTLKYLSMYLSSKGKTRSGLLSNPVCSNVRHQA